MKDFNNTTVAFLATLFSSLIIVLLSAYFSSFVTYADFNNHKMKYQKTSTEMCTKLEIIIKNQDQIKTKLNLL